MLYLLFIFSLLFACLYLKVIRLGQGEVILFSFSKQETLPLRGLLAVSVWLTHLCPYFVKDNILFTDFCLWGPPSVACFFMLSGYGLSCSFEKNGTSYLSNFFANRLLKLFLPFFVMTIIYQGYCITNDEFHISSIFAEPFPKSWFVYALFIWYVIFYCCYRFFSNKYRIPALWICTALYLAITIYLKMGYYWMSILPMPLIMTIVPYEIRIKEYIKNNPYIVITLSAFVTLGVLLYATMGQYGLDLPAWGPPVYTVLPFSLLIITYFLGGWKNIFLNFLGKISYEFYIIHGFVVMKLGDYCWFGLSGILNALISLTMSFCLIVFLAWTMNKACGYLYHCYCVNYSTR